MTTDYSKKVLETLFYKKVPKARKINPFFREQFELIYDASNASRKGSRVLNIYSSNDLSGERESIFSKFFFSHTNYKSIDYWEDKFIDAGNISDLCKPERNEENPYLINYPDNYFDTVITTKIIMEHVSDPKLALCEIFRVIKPGGKAFIIAPHIRRQHQAPYDYYRFTEYALKNVFIAAGFKDVDIQHTGGFMAVIGYYFYFFQRGLNIPVILERFLDLLHYYIIEPFFYALDKLDNGYGRDMTLYFMVRAKK